MAICLQEMNDSRLIQSLQGNDYVNSGSMQSFCVVINNEPHVIQLIYDRNVSIAHILRQTSKPFAAQT